MSEKNNARQKHILKKAQARGKRRKVQVYETVVLGGEFDEQLRDGAAAPKVRLPALDAGKYRITVRHVGSKSVEGRTLRLTPNRSHLTALKRGAQSWNQWRRRNHTVRPNLRGASLPPGIDLYKADLSEADLTGATLERANLSRALLYSSKLVSSNLNGANLHGAQLNHSDLSEANLADAELVAATFTGAILAGTEFRNSMLGSTSLDAVDLSTSKGLDTTRHVGPSSIGADTIYKSQGKIPEVFLRGVGVPEPFIANMKSLIAAMEPIQFYSCFISYSTKDQEFADLLHAQLQSKGARVWLATEDLKIGDRFRARIDEAIRLYDKLLLVLSKDSVKSPWVQSEVEAAFEKERRQNRTVLFPIRLDDAVMETDEAWAADIRRMRHIGDFRKWKDHDEFQKAFARLMRDLKAEEKPPDSRPGHD